MDVPAISTFQTSSWVRSVTIRPRYSSKMLPALNGNNVRTPTPLSGYSTSSIKSPARDTTRRLQLPGAFWHNSQRLPAPCWSNGFGAPPYSQGIVEMLIDIVFGGYTAAVADGHAGSANSTRFKHVHILLTGPSERFSVDNRWRTSSSQNQRRSRNISCRIWMWALECGGPR